MSIKDYNMVLHITDTTTNKLKCTICESDYFDDDVVSYYVTLGELQLLKNIRQLLRDGSDVFISIGYKE